MLRFSLSLYFRLFECFTVLAATDDSLWVKYTVPKTLIIKITKQWKKDDVLLKTHFSTFTMMICIPLNLRQEWRFMYIHLFNITSFGRKVIFLFSRFIAQSTERTLNLYLWATSEFSHTVPAIGKPHILTEDEFDDTILWHRIQQKYRTELKISSREMNFERNLTDLCKVGGPYLA